MFSTIASATDSVRCTQGRPLAMSEMLSMVCSHDYDVPCKESLVAKGQAPESNTIRMYNKLMCGKSFCGKSMETKIDKLIKA